MCGGEVTVVPGKKSMKLMWWYDNGQKTEQTNQASTQPVENFPDLLQNPAGQSHMDISRF